MWKQRNATNLLIRIMVALIVITIFSDTALSLSDKRLCADENCSGIISLGTGKINYRAGEEGMVSFNINAPIRVKSKSAGSDPSLWGIEVNGREGYAPKEFIRESKILIGQNKLKYIVDVVKPGNKVPILNSSEKFIEQENTVDATTTNPLEVIPKESTEKPLTNDSKEVVETPVTVTPVFREIVEGTQIPMLDNESDDKKNIQLNQVPKILSADENNDIELNEFIGINAKEESPQDRNTETDQTEEIRGDIYTTLEILDVETVKIEGDVINQNMEIEDNEPNAREPDVETVKIEGDVINRNTEIEDNEPNALPTSQKLNSVSEHFGKNEEELKEIDETTVNTSTNNKLLENTSESNLRSNDVLNAKRNVGVQHDAVSEDDKGHFVEGDKMSQNTFVHPLSIEEVNNVIKESYEIKTQVDIKDDHNPTHLKNEETMSQEIINNDNNNLRELPLSVQDNFISENFTNVEEKVINKTANSTNINGSAYNTENNENNPTVEVEGIAANNDTIENAFDSDLNLKDEHNNKEKFSEQHDRINTDENSSSEQQFASEPLHVIDKKENTVDQIITIQSNTESTQNLEFYQENRMKNEYVEDSLGEIGLESEKISQTNTEAISTKNNIIENLSNYDIKLSDPLKIKENFAEQEENLSSLTKQSNVESMQRTDEGNFEKALNEFEIESEKKSQMRTDNEQPNHISEVVAKEIFDNGAESNDKVIEDNVQNFNPTTNVPNYELSMNIPPVSEYHVSNEDLYLSSPTTGVPPNNHYVHKTDDSSLDYNYVTTENPRQDSSLYTDEISMGYGSIESLHPVSTPASPGATIEKSKVLPPSTPAYEEIKENKGLFATIMGTVNNIWSVNKKPKHTEDGDELHRILYSKHDTGHKIPIRNEDENLQYCKQIGPDGDCPQLEQNFKSQCEFCDNSIPKSMFSADLSFDSFLKILAGKILEFSELLAFLVIVAATSLFFLFGYYCFCNSSREGDLLSKLNQLESSLLASHKENAILKHNLMSTKHKLASIEDNSFGSNDMVVSLKKELEEELLEKAGLQEQISALQKELENAADAGIELNKIVSELLSNQTGDESIISSVEELQKQLNEQQNTILEINASLAEKSRENSELQLHLAEQNARYETELANVQRDNDELEHEKGNLQTRLDELRNEFDKDITIALEGKNIEIKRLQNEIIELTKKIEGEHTKWQTSMAKVEALEECLKNVRKDPNVNITEVIDVANVKAQLIEAQKNYKTFKERFELEMDSRKLIENQLQIASAEVEKLKQDFNQSEKDKLEAQTRLEVLANYFKEKENQLQKELSLKEAMWLKQQGETTTTVDRLTAMQEEIQSLKSQNDSLRAEIEAQVAAHKAQTGTLENRAHETWLAARQSDRRYEEARAEATALRRKLTALAGSNVNEATKPPAGPGGLSEELTNVPSPVHMESPGSPILGRMPPPPFLPPPFMGPPPPFIGMPPPPPFVPPGEMRPAPLGRIMSPPPQRSGRFSPQHLDYEDYLDYEGNNTWHRHTYSPPPRTYRSLSPTDSRYNYGTERDLISTYDTETDFSPPPSPRDSRRRGGNSTERIDNNSRNPYNNTNKFNSANKEPLSSGSEKSYNSPSHHNTRLKKANNGGGKSLV